MTFNGSRTLPDPEINLRDARDFILTSSLGRLALSTSHKGLTLFLHDLVDALYRLVQSCHLPEFTDHGLPHLCSLVDRISRWELPSGAANRFLHDQLSPDEGAILLIATLIHDIGMLSQNPIDLPDDDVALIHGKANWPDVASWVRHTHVTRLEKLVRRILKAHGHDSFMNEQLFNTSVHVAQSHQRWPWEWAGDWISSPRLRGLAAVVAVVDLLDEDSARCDTTTLLEHREGNELNRAHWLRHALTANRVIVENARIRVELVKPPGTTDVLRPVFSALRNHFRLVSLYDNDLRSLGAPITNIDLSPSTGIPSETVLSLNGWNNIHGFPTEEALCYQLIRTFMAAALKDVRRIDSTSQHKLRTASLEDVDLEVRDTSDGVTEPWTDYEKTFNAIASVTK